MNHRTTQRLVWLFALALLAGCAERDEDEAWAGIREIGDFYCDGHEGFESISITIGAEERPEIDVVCNDGTRHTFGYWK